MQTVKTASTAKGSSDMTAAKGLNGTSTDNATLETPLAFGCVIIDPRCATDPQAVADEYQKRKRLTWKDLSPARRSYAKQLYIDEGWTLSEAILLAYHDGPHRPFGKKGGAQ